MRKTVLYIAMSLDGYIADENGKVDWLDGENEEIESEDSYVRFIKRVDTVVMGWNTYYQVISELSPSKWVYEDLMTYVITHRENKSTDNIKFIHEPLDKFIREIKLQKGKDIWICGGADIVSQLLKEDLIDEFYITVIPVILGRGISLFNKIKKELKLLTCRKNGRMVEIIYERKETI